MSRSVVVQAGHFMDFLFVLNGFNLIIFTLATALARAFTAALDVVFVGAAMALDAVIKFADAFFNVFAPDVVGRVFVTAVTGGAAVVVADMASCAAGVVVFVQRKVLVVVESGWRPLVLRVALQAVTGDLFVQRISGHLVAGLARLTGIGLEQAVVKLALPGKALHPCMVAVASHTVLADQLLMKCRFDWLDERDTFRGLNTDVSWLMATGAFFGTGAAQRGVAGETIAFKRFVPGDQMPRSHHQVRVNEHQHCQSSQITGQDELDDFAHTQPQNRNTLMMWPKAITVKTM
jgi:hypothetical protein